VTLASSGTVAGLSPPQRRHSATPAPWTAVNPSPRRHPGGLDSASWWSATRRPRAPAASTRWPWSGDTGHRILTPGPSANGGILTLGYTYPGLHCHHGLATGPGTGRLGSNPPIQFNGINGLRTRPLARAPAPAERWLRPCSAQI